MSATVIFSNMPVPLEDGEQDSIYNCTEADNPVLFTSDTETYQLAVQLTAQQWVELFSAATAGADLLYPDRSIDVVFPLRRAVDCMPTFCEAVQECITSNINIQLTLIQITNYWGTEGEDGENPPVIETNPIIAEDCDLDNLFGACTQMIDLIDTTITDIFETIEAITNDVELANEVLELVPGLNFLASVLDIANVLQEQLAENYAAAYTATVRDDLRCALFCACQADCTLDYARMCDLFATLAGQAILTLDLEDFIEFFTTGTFSGVEVVYAAFWFVAGMMSYGGKVLNIDADRLVQMSASFLNDPDSDWSTLCDTCGWSTNFDLDTSASGTYAGTEAGQTAAYYSAGNGWGHGFYGHIIRVDSLDTLDCFVSTVNCKHSNMPSLNPTVRLVGKSGGESGTIEYDSGYLSLSAGANDTTFTVNKTIDWFEVLYVSGIPGNRPTITGYLYDLTVNGTGGNVWSGT